MNRLKEKRVQFIFLLIIALALVIIMLYRATNDSTESRYSTLQSEIDAIRVKPIFYVASPGMQTEELFAAFIDRPGIWGSLVPPPKPQAAKPTGPDFKVLLQGVQPSGVQMTVGGEVKVRIATPEHPRGTWVKLGDTIKTTTVVGITDQHVIFEKSQAGKAYRHKIPRK